MVIEQAKGRLAGERDVSVDDAFAMMRNHARSHHMTLRDLASAVVERGAAAIDGSE